MKLSRRKVSDVTVHGSPVIDGDDKDNKDAVVDGEDSPVSTDAAGIEWYVFVALEFLDASLRIFFSSKIVQGCTDAPGIFFWKIQQVFLSPTGEVNRVHFRSRGYRRTR